MRRLTAAAPVLVGILLSVARAATAQGSLTAAQRTALTDSVRRVTDAVFAAGKRRDLDQMFSYYSPATTLLHDGKAENWADHQKGARTFYKTLRAVDVHPLDYQIDVLSPTVAVWRGMYAFNFTDSAGQVTAGKAANTWVLARGTSRWQIVHVHISDPLPTGK